MNFKEWSKRYYPNESEETIHKMSHAWAAAHISFAMSRIHTNSKGPINKKLKPESNISFMEHIEKMAETARSYPAYKRACFRLT